MYELHDKKEFAKRPSHKMLIVTSKQTNKALVQRVFHSAQTNPVSITFSNLKLHQF